MIGNMRFDYQGVAQKNFWRGGNVLYPDLCLHKSMHTLELIELYIKNWYLLYINQFFKNSEVGGRGRKRGHKRIKMCYVQY